MRSVALGWYTGVVPPQCTIASPRIMILQQSQKADIRVMLDTSRMSWGPCTGFLENTYSTELTVATRVQLRLAATLLLLPWVLVVLGAADAAADEAGVATSEAQKPGQTVAPEKPRVQGVEQSSMGGKFNSLLNKAKEKLFFRAFPFPDLGCTHVHICSVPQCCV